MTLSITVNNVWDSMIEGSFEDVLEQIDIDATKAAYETAINEALEGFGFDSIAQDWCDHAQYGFIISNTTDSDFNDFHVSEAIADVWDTQKFWVYK